MSDFDFNRSSTVKINTSANGGLSIDSVDTFREIAASGDRQLFYAYAEAHGSSYGAVGNGYHAQNLTWGPDQSWRAWPADV
ncbi:MAG: hypothetical protein U5N55_13695 [Cypionkella sp.]|nr:hypothetical protein [Cypionkella sp.]